jgi:hypothetical protein
MKVSVSVYSRRKGPQCPLDVCSSLNSVAGRKISFFSGIEPHVSSRAARILVTTVIELYGTDNMQRNKKET